jgi:NADPH:quinone reductase
MKAIVVNRWVDPSELELGDAPDPEPEAGMLSLDVRAAGCSFADILAVAGKYQVKHTFPYIPGTEVAGVVSHVGKGVEGFSVGDRVMSMVPQGGYAERINVAAAIARPVPKGMSFEQAAAFPIVYPTSHAALVHRGRLKKGETLLITAAAGGVGLSSVQIGKALGARVIALAGGDEKLDVVRRAGADVAIDYKLEDWVERVKSETGGRGVDVIVENVGGDVFDGCMRTIAWDGRLVVVGFAGGRIPELKVNRVLLKHCAVIGLFWGMMILHQPELVAESLTALDRMHAKKQIEPMIWKAFPLAEAGAALEALASRQSWGKIVLVP